MAEPKAGLKKQPSLHAKSFHSNLVTMKKELAAMESMVPSQAPTLMENYYFPCDEVINFEKTLIKHSIVWEYAKARRAKGV